MTIVTRARRVLSSSDLPFSILLGLLGFLVNRIALDLGWGLHFLFGNALIFVFFRLLKPSAIVLAVTIASLETIDLWGHPWAWMIWTVEAAFVAYLGKGRRYLQIDIAFWLLLGTPLIFVLYGLLMNTDAISMLLVMLKQGLNGIANVIIGESAYIFILTIKRRSWLSGWPKVSFANFIVIALVAITMAPAIIFIYISAPKNEAELRYDLQNSLQIHLDMVDNRIQQWLRMRTASIEHYAGDLSSTREHADTRIPNDLSADISDISMFSEDGTPLWSIGANWTTPPPEVQRLATVHMREKRRVQLVRLASLPEPEQASWALVLPIRTYGKPETAVALLKWKEFKEQILPHVSSTQPVEIFIADAHGRVSSISGSSRRFSDRIARMTPQLLGTPGPTFTLDSFGQATNAMNAFLNAASGRKTRISGLPGWQLLAVTSDYSAVSARRQKQLAEMSTFCLFVLLVAVYASWFGARFSKALRHLARDAAELALMGTNSGKIDDLVIHELNDISGTLESSKSLVRREHGALIAYQRRLNSISRYAPLIVYALDIKERKKGELTYVSGALETLLGYSIDDVKQPGWWSHAIHPADYELCASAFSDLYPTKIVRQEYRLRHKLGHYIWFYDTLAVEIGQEPGHCEGTGVLMDISDRKAANQRLMQADKMVSLGRMLAGTAHELNQPLNFIKMASANLRESARRGQLDVARLIPKLDNIISYVGRASAIILQMRMFGRVPQTAPEPIDIKSVVDAVADMVAPQLELDRTQLEISDCIEGLRVRSLPVLLEQVLLNLILNANDAILERRKTNVKEDGKIKVSATRHEWQVVIKVEDNGTGIPDHVMGSLFEPFFTTKPPKNGTGLGLSISYGIIRDLGGNIEAENTPQGALFTIRLPIVE